jgi:hypothetical protein
VRAVFYFIVATLARSERNPLHTDASLSLTRPFVDAKTHTCDAVFNHQSEVALFQLRFQVYGGVDGVDSSTVHVHSRPHEAIAHRRHADASLEHVD